MINEKKYNDFIWKYNTRYAEYNLDKYRNQCMDLFWFYLKEVLGVDPRPYQGWGNPVGVWNNFDKIAGAKEFFVKIPNNPINVPQKGGIMFYKWYPLLYGLDGHVDIFDHGDMYTTVCFGQNYPTGKPCQFTKHGSNKIFHGYRGTLGWLTPKS